MEYAQSRCAAHRIVYVVQMLSDPTTAPRTLSQRLLSGVRYVRDRFVYMYSNRVTWHVFWHTFLLWTVETVFEYPIATAVVPLPSFVELVAAGCWLSCAT